jgi:hypothetical protein
VRKRQEIDLTELAAEQGALSLERLALALRCSPEQAFLEMLVNLAHFADRTGKDFRLELEMAAVRYNIETDGQGGQLQPYYPSYVHQIQMRPPEEHPKGKLIPFPQPMGLIYMTPSEGTE